eukprot:CAMPEP_0202042034 /NCGR_PEP_ID=MMETSP0962-20130828/25996_1 /ASSEMBLY_ACC=CAM_ASM_000488 /TAXON_ID=4773 /ORGANISM="Schizochytrium aggregatum, Strain ATCC28209" /LENGTH=41 /DNA_ID= /DNA_START= /DNA_END= /DNA_ORIENTATION=
MPSALAVVVLGQAQPIAWAALEARQVKSRMSKTAAQELAVD